MSQVTFLKGYFLSNALDDEKRLVLSVLSKDYLFLTHATSPPIGYLISSELIANLVSIFLILSLIEH